MLRVYNEIFFLGDEKSFEIEHELWLPASVEKEKAIERFRHVFKQKHEGAALAKYLTANSNDFPEEVILEFTPSSRELPETYTREVFDKIAVTSHERSMACVLSRARECYRKYYSWEYNPETCTRDWVVKEIARLHPVLSPEEHYQEHYMWHHTGNAELDYYLDCLKHHSEISGKSTWEVKKLFISVIQHIDARQALESFLRQLETVKVKEFAEDVISVHIVTH